ncbi:MAG TPA: response regulator, partial [Promineifilum sp.]|nr:response regulator [Promineifilum sp.]
MTLILVIDDDDLVSRTLQRALKHYDYQVMTASSGIEGLQLARRHRPDLFILDIMMPGVDGYQVCRQIRGDPLLQDAPVLFLTAKAKDEDKIEGFRAGGDDYLVKPFNMQELELRVKAILRRAGPEKTEPEPTVNEVVVGDVVLDCRTFKVNTP